MNRARIVFILMPAALLTLAACSSRGKQPIYVASEEVKPIEAPPGLDQPEVRNIYEVPGYSLPELAAQGKQEEPPEVQPSSVAEQSRSQIRFGRTGLYLAVQGPAESVWQNLRNLLDQNGMQLERIEERQRRYWFHFSHEPIRPEIGFFDRLTFWSRPETIDYSGDYIARVVEEESRGKVITRVELLDADGQVIDMDRAEFVLARLREQLG